MHIDFKKLYCDGIGNPDWKKLVALCFGLIALVGLVWATMVNVPKWMASASGANDVVEAETGNRSGAVAVRSDTNASGGSYLEFVATVISSPTVTQTPVPTNTPVPPGPTNPPGLTREVSFGRSSVNFMNPERGYFRVSADSLGESNYSFVRNSGLTLARSYIRLDPYVNSSIPSSFLTNLEAGFARIREAKIKIIPRLAYNYGGSNRDADVLTLAGHLQQLQPVFARNSDVIYAIPAGVVGEWGEWHNSQHYPTGNNGVGGDYSGGTNSLDTVYKMILQSMPANRMVLLRYPPNRLGIFPNQILTSATAFGGSQLARTGFHNDCFLATNSWEGNYTTYANYVHNESRYVPVLGAVCQDTARLNCTNARAELSSMHWSGLNYDTPNLSILRNGGCTDEIGTRLGYRFWLKKIILPSRIVHGTSFTVNFEIVNDGYAPIYNFRQVYAVLENNATGGKTIINLGLDPRKWQPQADLGVNQVSAVVNTSGLVAGSYKLYLWLPDDSASIKNIPEYAVRLASIQGNGADVWNNNTGYNYLTDVNLE